MQPPVDKKGRRKTLGEMLLEEHLITAQQLESALEWQKKQGGYLGEILINQGVVKSDDLAAILSIQLNVPLIDLKRHKVQLQALRLIPEDTARKNTLIPIDVIGNSLVVVMAHPGDIRMIEDIKAQAKMRIEVALGIPEDIVRAIDLNYRSKGAIESHMRQFAPAPSEIKATEELIARTPVAQTLDLLITQAVRDGASDIHIEPQVDRLRIRYRVDGVLHDMFSLPLSAHVSLVSRVKVLAAMNIAEQRRPQDGQFSTAVDDRNIDIRVASMGTANGERVSLRILDKSLSIFHLNELGFLPSTLQEYQTMMSSPFGMILVSGPTGSGKTTTLYASINSLNRKERNIMTIEDPIEYHFADINQTQVNRTAGLTFTSGLFSILRHDPDIILVGEIRDKDTATAAVQAALTGHLIFSSIHAGDAVGTLLRLMDLGIEPYLISSTLIGVVGQRMVRRLCPHCRIPYQPSEDELLAYNEELKGLPPAYYTGIGCNLCSELGYRGRTGIFEVLRMTEGIRKLLRNNPSSAAIRSQALAEGMITMKHDGMLKVREGITSVSEVLRSVFFIG